MNNEQPTFEVIDAKELAKRWRLPESWIRSHTRECTPADKRIPHLKFDRYIRYEWNSPALEAWIAARRKAPAEKNHVPRT